MTTTESPTELLTPYILPAQRSHAKFYPRGAFVSITLAQGIIESNWFRDVSGRNNFFGIKATADEIAHGLATRRMTHETISGVYRAESQYFADYPSIEACFDAHNHLLTQPWYARCMIADNPRAYAHALWECHYATGIPDHPYDAVLIETMNRYDLYRYDQRPPFNFPAEAST